MPCSNVGVSPDNITDADKLQYAAIEKVQIDKMSQIEEALDAIKIPTIKKGALVDLSISLGAELDVGGQDATPFDTSDTFFAPCDWPLQVLEAETWRERGFWRNLDEKTPDPAILLQFPQTRTVWYEQCLYRLRSLAPHLWDFYRYVHLANQSRLLCFLTRVIAKPPSDQVSIRERIGLSLPYRLFHPRPWAPMHYHEYYGKWVMFAPV